MTDMISLKDAQAEIDGVLVAEICRDFGINFRDVYPEHILARGVGPEQAFIGLAIKRGHLALPAVQPDDAAIREAARVLLKASDGSMPLEAKMAAVKAIIAREGKCQPVSVVQAWQAALETLFNNPGKEVMPDDAGTARPSHDTAPLA